MCRFCVIHFIHVANIRNFCEKSINIEVELAFLYAWR